METVTKKNAIIIAVIALLIGGGLGYESTHLMGGAAAPAAGTFTRGGGSFTRAGGAAGGSALVGTVAKIDSTSITLNTRDGSSHVVLLTPATTVSKSVTGTLNDVSVGSNVLIAGTTNADGSLSGTMIQLQNGVRPGATAPLQ